MKGLKRPFSSALHVTLRVVFALALPFLLPEMHERYFYLADVLSIIYAFYFPRYFFIAILVQLCSLLSYAPYFLNTQVVGLSYVAFIELVLNIIVFTDLILTLYPNMRKKKEVESVFVDETSEDIAGEVVSS